MPFLFKSLGLTKPATLGSTLADMKCSSRFQLKKCYFSLFHYAFH